MASALNKAGSTVKCHKLLFQRCRLLFKREDVYNGMPIPNTSLYCTISACIKVFHLGPKIKQQIHHQVASISFWISDIKLFFIASCFADLVKPQIWIFCGALISRTLIYIWALLDGTPKLISAPGSLDVKLYAQNIFAIIFECQVDARDCSNQRLLRGTVVAGSSSWQLYLHLPCPRDQAMCWSLQHALKVSSSSLTMNPALFRVDVRERVSCLNLKRFLVLLAVLC